MKRYIIGLFILFLASCTSIEVSNKSEVIDSFKESKKTFISITKQNKKDEIDKFFISGIRNNIILKEIKKYDFNDFLFLIPDKSIEVLGQEKIKTDMLLNYGINTYYFNVIWKKENNIWKIYSIYEK